MVAIRHVPGLVRRVSLPWEKITERTHVGVLTSDADESLELMADGIIDSICRDRSVICCISNTMGRSLREKLDTRTINHRAAVADGRLRWVETQTGKNLAEAVTAVISAHPPADIPLLLVLPLWSTVQRKPAARRALESKIGELILTGKASIACFYPISCHTKAVLISAMDAHRLIWLDGKFSHNPFYFPLHTRKSRHRAEELFHQRLEAIHSGSRLSEIRGMDSATSHELNNLLSAIIGNTEMLELTIPANVSIFDQLNRIHDAARRAAQICRRIPLTGPASSAAISTPAAPSSALPAAQHAIPTPPSIPWRGWGTLLLVDDEETIRIVGKQILERIGFKVITASDGLEAIRQYKTCRERIRVVILDLLMPHMTGKDAFMEIRHLNKEQPIIIASGLGAEEVQRLFPQDTFLASLPKPFGIIELTKALKTLLGEETTQPGAVG